MEACVKSELSGNEVHWIRYPQDSAGAEEKVVA